MPKLWTAFSCAPLPLISLLPSFLTSKVLPSNWNPVVSFFANYLRRLFEWFSHLLSFSPLIITTQITLAPRINFLHILAKEVLSKPLLLLLVVFFFLSISCLFHEKLFSYHVWFFPSSLFLDCKMKFVRNKSECLDVPRNILK